MIFRSLFSATFFLLGVIIAEVLLQVFAFSQRGFPSVFLTPSPSKIYGLSLRLSGVLAFIFISAALVIGALRPVLVRIYRSAAFWKLHTLWVSSLGVGMALAHVGLYFLYESRLNRPIALGNFLPDLAQISTVATLGDIRSATSTLIFIGVVAYVMFTGNAFLTHIPGVTGKRWWRPLHLSNFAALGLIIVHSYFIGTDTFTNPFMLVLYAVVTALAVLGILYRFIRWLWMRSHGRIHSLLSVQDTPPTADTARISMSTSSTEMPGGADAPPRTNGQ